MQTVLIHEFACRTLSQVAYKHRLCHLKVKMLQLVNILIIIKVRIDTKVVRSTGIERADGREAASIELVNIECVLGDVSGVQIFPL